MTSHVLSLPSGRYFVKKCLHKQFLLKNGGTLGYKYYRTKAIVSFCMSSFFSYNVFAWQVTFLFLPPRTIFCKKMLHMQFFLKTVALWDINSNAVRKTTIVPLSVCRAFFSHNLYLRDKSRSFFAHRTISCKKYWHKQFFLKTVELWDININVVWKTTIVFLSVCRAFFSYNLYLRDKSRSFFAPRTIFCKKMLT